MGIFSGRRKSSIVLTERINSFPRLCNIAFESKEFEFSVMSV